MPDIFYVITRWWKQILLIMVLSLVTVGAIVFFLPVKYLSIATAVPANPALSDKASVFNENIQIPSPNITTEEALDIIIGTAQLDTAYLAVAATFNLWDHYKTEEKGDAALYKAMYLLRQNTNVSKSGYGELKVKVWDTDKDLAAKLANAIMDQLALIHRGIQNENNKIILEQLSRDIASIYSARGDTTFVFEAMENKDKILGDLAQYEKLAIQYQLMVDAKPPALITVERARPSAWPDKPKRVKMLAATAVLSFLFALLVALVLERRKKKL